MIKFITKILDRIKQKKLQKIKKLHQLEASRIWKKNNSKRVKMVAKKYYIKNKDEYKIRYRVKKELGYKYEYSREQIEKKKIRAREYREKNKEKIKGYKSRQKDKVREYNRNYYIKNKKYFQEYYRKNK